MSGTTLIWQVKKSSLSPSLSTIPSQLRSLLTCQRRWGECPDLCKKTVLLLADDCQLSRSLQLDPRGQLEPLSHCRQIQSASRRCNCANKKTADTAYKRLMENVRFQKQTLLLFFSGNILGLYWVLKHLKGKESVSAKCLLRSTRSPSKKEKKEKELSISIWNSQRWKHTFLSFI